MDQIWEKIDGNLISNYKILKIYKNRYINPYKGSEHILYVMDSPDWVNVIPVTPDMKVVLIRQFRPGTNEITVEIPGGMIDSGDISPESAAKRELEEETGYIAKEYTHIGQVRPNPAFLNNTCHTVLATNALPTGNIHFDPSEQIETFLVDLFDIPEMIKKHTITHGLVINAFTWLELNKFNDFKLT